VAGGRSLNRFSVWLAAALDARGLSQADLARSVGVADTQVSRWRRGQVVPTVPYLQRIADTFGVDRATLDRLVGLPVAEARLGDDPAAPDVEAELQAHQARLREVLQRRLPRSMWRAYVEACVALADGLSASAQRVLHEAADEAAPHPPMGFRAKAGHEPPAPSEDVRP
jgi:transcriptional regulator with XRE-family HTH domain